MPREPRDCWHVHSGQLGSVLCDRVVHRLPAADGDVSTAGAVTPAGGGLSCCDPPLFSLFFFLLYVIVGQDSSVFLQVSD